MAAEVDFQTERAEFEAVLSSGIFARSPILAQMLKYVCERHFSGQSHEIKEYNIAVEAFGRPPDFDQARDSIVRVEAHRLRKRLQEFYRGAGASHEVQIVLPPGNYIPQFVRRVGAAPPVLCRRKKGSRKRHRRTALRRLWRTEWATRPKRHIGLPAGSSKLRRAARRYDCSTPWPRQRWPC